MISKVGMDAMEKCGQVLRGSLCELMDGLVQPDKYVPQITSSTHLKIYVHTTIQKIIDDFILSNDWESEFEIFQKNQSLHLKSEETSTVQVTLEPDSDYTVFLAESLRIFDELFDLWYEYAQAPRRVKTAIQLKNYFEDEIKSQLDYYIDSKQWTQESLVWGLENLKAITGKIKGS